jgi:16S rRNA (cytidine1402-2'-O)-methyltransferase
MPGTLYVVATPIGNLQDISARALQVLREAAVIAAEDTRVTRRLLSHYEIHTPLTSYHAHTHERKTEQLLERLQGGEDVAVVSDAGTPGVSDPGEALVRAAVAAGVPVVPIPGASAVTAALCASGLDPSRFLFHGFLPRSRGDQRRSLEPLRALPHTLVFYEAPGRLPGTLAQLQEVFGDRAAVVGREITKKFEEFVRGSLSEVEAHFRAREARGECVILVAGSTGEQAPATEADLDAVLRARLESGYSVKDAAKAAAEELSVPRRDAYARAQELTDARRETEPE